MPDRPMMSAATAGLALLAASEVPNFLAGMMPSLMTIQRFGADEYDRAALRRGEVLGGALALVVGVGASLVADNPAPAVATVAILAVMLVMYEHAIRNPRPDAAPINQQPEGGFNYGYDNGYGYAHA